MAPGFRTPVSGSIPEDVDRDDWYAKLLEDPRRVSGHLPWRPAGAETHDRVQRDGGPEPAQELLKRIGICRFVHPAPGTATRVERAGMSAVRGEKDRVDGHPAAGEVGEGVEPVATVIAGADQRGRAGPVDVASAVTDNLLRPHDGARDVRDGPRRPPHHRVSGRRLDDGRLGTADICGEVRAEVVSVGHVPRAPSVSPPVRGVRSTRR